MLRVVDNTEAAQRAVAKIAKLEGELADARRERDIAIRGMANEDGMTVPNIARALGWDSTSNVRWIIKTGPQP